MMLKTMFDGNQTSFNIMQHRATTTTTTTTTKTFIYTIQVEKV